MQDIETQVEQVQAVETQEPAQTPDIRIDPKIEKMINDTVTKAVLRVTKAQKVEVRSEKPVQNSNTSIQEQADYNSLKREFEELKAEREKEKREIASLSKQKQLSEILSENEITNAGAQKLVYKFLEDDLIVENGKTFYKDADGQPLPLLEGIQKFLETDVGKALRPAKTPGTPGQKPILKTKTNTVTEKPVPPPGLSPFERMRWMEKNPTR